MIKESVAAYYREGSQTDCIVLRTIKQDGEILTTSVIWTGKAVDIPIEIRRKCAND